MPAIREQILGPHPITGVEGLWFCRTGDPDGTYVGLSRTEARALAQTVPPAPANTRRQRIIAALTDEVSARLGGGYIVGLSVEAALPFDISDIVLQDAP